jgi:hypothetical protein
VTGAGEAVVADTVTSQQISAMALVRAATKGRPARQRRSAVERQSCHGVPRTTHAVAQRRAVQCEPASNFDPLHALLAALPANLRITQPTARPEIAAPLSELIESVAVVGRWHLCRGVKTNHTSAASS